MFVSRLRLVWIRCVRRRSVSLFGWERNVPRQQLFNAVDGVIGDRIEHIAEIGLRVDAVQLG